MYRVIIVDDEQWALIGIRKFLERGSDQFQIIYETTNPIEALEAICSMQPDLVFTDIRMPEISGLDLITKTRQRGVSSEFVIISGFSEFAFAQQALRAGALDYLLKPLDIPNARDILLKIQQHMDARHQLDDLSLYGLFHAGHGDPASLVQPRLPKPLMSFWQMATVFLSESVKPELTLHLPDTHQMTQLQLGPHKMVCIVNTSDDRPQALFDAFAAMQEDIVSCGLSPVVDSADKIPAMLRIAEFAVYDTFVYPEQHVFHYRAAQPTKIFNIWQQISKELRARRYDQLRTLLSHLPALFRAQNLTANDALNLWNLIAENIHEYLPSTDALSDIIPLRVHSLIDKFVTMEHMCQYLTDQLAAHDKHRDGSANQHFKKLLRFVDAHYADSLNLQELCNQYFINVSYCCELFRKETQMTFTQYITRLRMTHACELLIGTPLPLKTICERVGYNDYFYFDKVFKKNIGCTPSEYRKRNHDE